MLAKTLGLVGLSPSRTGSVRKTANACLLPIVMSVTFVLGTNHGTVLQAAPGTQAATLPAPLIMTPILEGATEIEGTYSSPNAKVKVFVDGKKVDSVELDSQNGTFTANLKSPLAMGQKVTAQQVANNTSGNMSVEVEVQPFPHDWGRANAHFTFGVVAAQERDEFSETDLHLALNLEYNWLQPPPGKKRSWLVTSYIDMRLTSIPVLAVAESPPADPALGDPPPAVKQQDSEEDFESFVASRKAALMQAGLYAPVYFKKTTWDFKGDKNALFVGPIVKVGFQTITQAVKSARRDPDDLFEFWAAGARLGHFKFEKSESSTPNLVSYLDITVGRWENFERCVLPPIDRPTENRTGIVSCETNPTLAPEIDFRIGIEGRLKIPKTPLQFGFELNTGQGQDDLRFIIGATFDIAKGVGKLRSPAGE